MNAKMITIDNVEFRYVKNTQLLSGLNLNLFAGHIHGLLGKNGEGKSTLLKLIAGLVFPTTGKIDTIGFDPSKRKPEMLREIFFLPEELPQILLTVEKYQEIYAPFYPNFNSEQFDQYLKEFEVFSKHDKLDKLSQGQKKKVLIAFGLATNTKLLLMDEPTNGLDIPSKAQFRRMVAAAINDERCLVISTHQVRDLDSLIDGIIIMEGHEIVFNEPIENITNKLLFKVSENNEKDETVIYTENTIQGFCQVCENKDNKDSRLDIELLFNAVVTDKKRIKQLFS